MTAIPSCIAVAQQFGDLIAKEEYSAEHALLTSEAQKISSPGDFKKAVVGMTSYAPGPIQEVVVMDETLKTGLRSRIQMSLVFMLR